MTNGQDGSLPDGYQEAKAALYWGVSPTEIINWPVYWVELAYVISEAENAVREKRESLAQRKAARKHGKRSR